MKSPIPVVVLHGFWGAPQDWDPVLNRIDAKLDIARQSPNLYESSQLGPEHDFSAWVENFFSEYPQKSFLFGYSLGGRLALHLALAKPQNFCGLVLVSTSPGIFKEPEITQRRAWEATWSERFETDSWDQLAKDWSEQKVFEGSLKAVSKKPLPREKLQLSLSRWSPTRHIFTEEALTNLAVPTLWCVGERDRKYLKIYESWPKQHIPGEVSVIPASGHRILFDQPEALADRMIDFIKRNT